MECETSLFRQVVFIYRFFVIEKICESGTGLSQVSLDTSSLRLERYRDYMYLKLPSIASKPLGFLFCVK